MTSSTPFSYDGRKDGYHRFPTANFDIFQKEGKGETIPILHPWVKNGYPLRNTLNINVLCVLLRL